jgi:hypothetical protein
MGVTISTTVMQAEGMNATGIQVPEEVIASLGAGKKPSVKVSLNDYSYLSTVAFMGGKFLIPLSSAHRESAGLKAGDPVEVKLELDLEPRTVEVPDDLKSALAAQDGLLEQFEKLSYSKRKEFVRQVVDAKTQETRVKRIALIHVFILLFSNWRLRKIRENSKNT